MPDYLTKIPKPPNSFMLFRRDFMHNNIPRTKQKDQGYVSKLAKERWNYIKTFKPEEHQFWVRTAEQVALDYRRRTASYVYQTPSESPSRVHDGQALGAWNTSFQCYSISDMTSTQPYHNATLQSPPPAQLSQCSQHQCTPQMHVAAVNHEPAYSSTPNSFAPSPSASDSVSTSSSPDDLLFDGVELDIEVGSFDNIVLMLDFHEQGIKTSMSKIDDNFFY